MGVKGLLNLLSTRSDFHELLLEKIVRGSTLIIDGNNFMFFIMRLNQKEQEEQPIDRRYGGSYEEFYEMIVREFTYLRDTLGFRLEVYFDGPHSSFKDDVIEDRRSKTLESWKKLYNILKYHQKVFDPDSIPLPCLTRFLFEYFLKRGLLPDIKLYNCYGEADVDAGLRCKELNDQYIREKQQIRAYVYSDDTDFFIMKDVPTIKFETFSLHFLDFKNPASIRHQTPGDQYPIKVWRRNVISKLLGFTNELQFVDFCIFLGSDFTKSFPRNLFHLGEGINNPDFPNDGKLRTICNIFDYIKNNLPLFVLSSNDENLQNRIDYSRRFYELTLDEGMYEEENHAEADKDFEEDVPSEEIKESLEEEEPVAEEENENRDYELNKSKLKELKHDFETFLRLNSDSFDFHEVPHFILKFMEQVLSRNLEEVSDESSNGANSSDNDSKLLFETIHVEALQDMTELLFQNQADKTFFLEPVWEDIMVAKVYQELLLLGLKRSTSYKDVKGQNWEQLRLYPAHFYYDGRTFHKCLYDRRNGKFNADHFLTVEKDDEENEEKQVVDKQLDLEEVGLDRLPVEENEEKQVVDKQLDLEEVGLDRLPVDDHEDTILSRLRNDRFLIVRGETGCGKSTRIPVMILNEAKKMKEKCQILVCEPHRAAAQGLYGYVRKATNAEIGLRLGMRGHIGSSNAKIIFATAGYVFHRYVNATEDLIPFTHIIIDEIHERSVENDLVCLLVKRLFQKPNSNLKVVLMSATVDASIFYDYFMSVPLPPLPSDKMEEELKEGDQVTECALSVGEKRKHEIEVFYIEDFTRLPELNYLHRIYDNEFALKQNAIIDSCDISQKMSKSLFKKQLEVAKELITQCEVGTSVLVFVAGMEDINYFEAELRNSSKFRVYPIHSELDRAEEEKALNQLPPELKATIVRVVVATNAAESSITIPDLNVVIDLGTNNIERNDCSVFSRTTLETKWISKPSAIQRAGRTGRIAPGKVFRIYTKKQYEKFPNKTEPDIKRKPLHDAIVRLLGNLSKTVRSDYNSIADAFLALIDPPIQEGNYGRLEENLLYLHRNYLITSNDMINPQLTFLGRFASQMPMSSQFSRVIVYSILLGLGGYGIILAAILAQNTRLSNLTPVNFAHPDDMNDTIRHIFLGIMQLDRDTYSEPIMQVLLYLTWMEKKSATVAAFKLNWKKISSLDKQVQVLVHRVNGFISELNTTPKISEITLEGLSKSLTIDQLILLRCILIWVSDGNILRLLPPSSSSSSSSSSYLGNKDGVTLMDSRESRLDVHRNTVLLYGEQTLSESKLLQLFPSSNYQFPFSNTNIPSHSDKIVGKVKIFDTNKGFGFIEPHGYINDVFVHVREITKGPRSLRVGEMVEFYLETGEGKFSAKEVIGVGGGAVLGALPKVTIDLTLERIPRITATIKMKSLKRSTVSIFQLLYGLLQNPQISLPLIWSWTNLPQPIARDDNSSIHSLFVLAVVKPSEQQLDDIDRIIIQPMIRESLSYQKQAKDTNQAEEEEGNINLPFASRIGFVEIQQLLQLPHLNEAEVRAAGVQFITIINPPVFSTILLRQILLLYSRGLEIFTTDKSVGDLETQFALRGFNFSSDSFEAFIGTTLNQLLNHQIQIRDSLISKPTYNVKLTFLPDNIHSNPNVSPILNYFTDLPLGFRLLNAYGAFRRGKCLSVGSIDYDPKYERRHQWYELSMEKATNLRGCYAKWEILQSKLAVDGTIEGRQGTEDKNEQKEEQEPHCFDQEKWSIAKIDHYSYLHYSYPKPTNPTNTVYAVANSVVIKQRGEDHTRITCDQVTFLPYTQSGVLLAMSAISQRWVPYLPDNSLQEEVKLATQCRELFEQWIHADHPLFTVHNSLRMNVLELHQSLSKLVNPQQRSLRQKRWW